MLMSALAKPALAGLRVHAMSAKRPRPLLRVRALPLCIACPNRTPAPNQPFLHTCLVVSQQQHAHC